MKAGVRYIILLAPALALAQFLAEPEAPVTATVSTSGNELSTLTVGTKIYTDSDQAFESGSIPAAFLGVKFIKTKQADRASTGTDVTQINVGSETRWVCVFHNNNIQTKPGWIDTDIYVEQDASLGITHTSLGTWIPYCADKTGALGFDGNVAAEDPEEEFANYFVTISQQRRKVANSVSGAGEYSFVTQSDTVGEGQTQTVAFVTRTNGTSGAVSVDVTEGAGSTCVAEDSTFTDPTTINWADTVGGQASGVSFTAGSVGADCTVDFEFTNATGGISAGSSNQTTTTTILDTPAIAAFPGAEGYGTETTHGRGGATIKVTNTNNSGAGSLRACMEATGARRCVFEVSGTITLTTPIQIGETNSNLAVYGQTAPGDGIAIRSAGDFEMIQLGSHPSPDPVHDVLMQHVRLRHGCPTTNTGINSDNLDIFRNSYNIVLDHMSFTWTSDENITMWSTNIHDVTISHSILAEGCVKTGVHTIPGGVFEFQNTGILIAGGSPTYRISIHHNLFAHTYFRIPAIYNTAGGEAGVEYINNIDYNCISQCAVVDLHTSYTSTANAVSIDLVGNYWKYGPDKINPTNYPLTLRKESSGAFQDISVHFTGGTHRDINGNATALHDEANNYNMIQDADIGNGAPPWASRGARHTDQPPNAVTATSYSQAYTDIVTNEDVGAQPLDSVDQRIVDDPADGGGWSSANIPAPWGSGSYPTLSSESPPTDTDDDGVPDSYETGVLSSNPSVADADGDHNTDGWDNLEDYIYSISGAGL